MRYYCPGVFITEQSGQDGTAAQNASSKTIS